MCDSPGKGGELARKDAAERSNIFNSNWKGNADMMVIGLKFLYIATPLPGYPAVNLYFRLLKLTKKGGGNRGKRGREFYL